MHRALMRWNVEWKHEQIHAGILSLRQEIPIREQVHALDVFVASGLPITNRMYEWRTEGGWVRRDPRGV